MDEAPYFIQDLAIILLSAAAGGWVARRLSLSPIVGYLIAGIVVGTPGIAFPYVLDPERIQVLSQLGLVFLMFFIGLGLRLKRLRELGTPTVIATAIGAILVLNLTRGIASAAGLSAGEGLFLAGMFMVSSSAIIGKVLTDSRLSHQRHGQLAMGITLLEDVVAVIMLTFLGTYAASGSFAEDPMVLIKTIGILAGFALLLIVVGLVSVPKLLHRFNRAGSSELETVFLTGLLFTLSLAAFKAGYSLALGAFLTGVVVAETPRLASIQRTLSGMRDVFTSVFFVAIGMVLDITLLPDALLLIAGGTILAVVGRTLAVWLSLLSVCVDGKTAFRTGLSVTPIGEFSFIIAGLGVATGVLPEKYHVVAVGVSLLTSFIAPVLIVRADAITNFVTPRGAGTIGNLLHLYRNLWSSLARLRHKNIVWRLARKRLIQIGAEVLVVTTILTFAKPLFHVIEVHLPERIFGAPLSNVYVIVVLVVCLGPLIAIWRNMTVLAMTLSDATVQAQPQLRQFEKPFTVTLQAIGAIGIILWLGSLVPAAVFRGWVLLAIAIVLTAVLALSWRRINRWHSEAEYRLQVTFAGDPEAVLQLGSINEWGLTIEEVTIPDYFAFAGKTIGEIGLRTKTGCSVVSIERQGYRLVAASPQTHLFPNDLLLVIGETSQVAAARKLLSQIPEFALPEQEENLDQSITDVAAVPDAAHVTGRTLAQLNWTRLYNVQVIGVNRSGIRQIMPGGDFRLLGGDELLLLGSDAGVKRVMSLLVAKTTVS